MENAGVNELAVTKCALPIVCVPKKDKSFHFCVDYLRLSAVTVPKSYPIPPVDERVDCLKEEILFSTLDAKAGFWQIKMYNKNVSWTTFVAHNELYKYTKMPFG